jgi:V/A-type H+-transporting ATPase subunit E
MTLNKVVDEILRKGEEKKAELIRTGEQERDGQIRDAEKKSAENKEKAEARLSATIAQMEQQELSSAELESKKALLMARKDVMDELKEHVLLAVARLPAERRKKMYSKLMNRAKKELGECNVYSNRADKDLISLPAGFASAGFIECAGGLVFESKDRAVRLDYRFESIVDDVWSRDMQKIYEMLFG